MAKNLVQNGHMLLKVGRVGGKLITGPAPVPAEKYTVSNAGTTSLSSIYYLMKQGAAPVMNKNFSGDKISIKGKEYNNGLGCVASSRIMFKLDGKADSFHAVVGVDDSYKGKEKARFRIYNGDFFGGQILYDGGFISRDTAVTINIPVKDVKYILLMIDGKEVPGNWADAKVTASRQN